jgi:dUTP pyrophosphatase
MKIKVKLFEGAKPFKSIDKGDWIDLQSNTTITLSKTGGHYAKLIPLGIAMQLPKGYEAEIRSRSSTYKHWGIILSNCVGTIDNSYGGDKDQWMASVIPFQNSIIKKGDRIVQFRIVLSQKATIWQKIKWLFSTKIKFEYVEKLNNNSRGGFGSTGKQ